MAALPGWIPHSEGQPFFALNIGPWSCFCTNAAADSNQETISPESPRAFDAAGPKARSIFFKPLDSALLPASVTVSDCPQASDAETSFGPPSDPSDASGSQPECGAPPHGAQEGEGSDQPEPQGTRRPTVICASLCWLNAIFVRLWPQMSKAIEKAVREEMEPILRAQLPRPLKNARFTTFSLGHTPPVFSRMKVCDTTLGQGVEFRCGVRLESDADIVLDFKLASVGIRSVKVSGELVCRLEPLLNEAPVVGGIVFYCLCPPKVDLHFTGAASIASYPGVLPHIRKIVDLMIAKCLVLPNVIAIPVGTDKQGVDRKNLYVPVPRALVRVTAVRAKDLIATSTSCFGRVSSDPHVRVRTSDEEWRSSPVKKTINPVWSRGVWTLGDVSHDFLVFDPEQGVSIEVYSQDVLIGKAGSCDVVDAFERSHHLFPLYAAGANPDFHEPTAGTLELRMEYLEICDVGQDPTQRDVCLLEVLMDSVFVPSSLASSVAVAVEVCKARKKTPVAHHANPQAASFAIEAALTDVVGRCQAKAMDPDLLRDIMGRKRRLTFRKGRASLGYFGGKAKEHTILTIPVDHALYFVIPTSALHREAVRLILLDANMLMLGEVSIPLCDVLAAPEFAVPQNARTRMKLLCDDTEAEMQLRLRLRGFEPGVPDRPFPWGSSIWRRETSPDFSAQGNPEALFSAEAKPAGTNLIAGAEGDSSLQGLNELALRLWPQMAEAITKIVYQEVTPVMQSQLPHSLKKARFNRLNLGASPPRLGPLQVLDAPGGLELRLGVSLSADDPIELDMVIAKLGVKALHASGEIIIRLAPLIEELPVVGGFVVYFLDAPKLDMTFTSAANFRGIPGTLRSLANALIGRLMVLPNVVAMPLGTAAQGVDRKSLHSPEAIGVLRATVLSASDLAAGDWSLTGAGTSDPYVRMCVSDEVWSSEYVRSTLNPVWTTGDVRHNFLVFDRDQGVSIDVYDYDFGLSDDHLGRAGPLTVRKALLMSKQPIPLFDAGADFTSDTPGEPKGEPKGFLKMNFEWLSAVGLQCGRVTPDGCLLEIRIDEVRMPASLGTSAGVSAKLRSGVRRHTPVKSGAPMDDASGAMTKGIRDLVGRCQAKAVDPSTIASITGVDITKALSSYPGSTQSLTGRRCSMSETMSHSEEEGPASEDGMDAARSLTVAIEDVIVLILPEGSIETEVVEISVIDGRLRPMASVKVSLLEVVQEPGSMYPSTGCAVSLAGPGDVEIEARLELHVRGLMPPRALRRS